MLLVSSEELIQYQQFHEALFTQVIKVEGLEADFTDGYLVIPLCIIHNDDPPICYIDDDNIRIVVSMNNNGVSPPKWPHSIDLLRNAVVSKNYADEVRSGGLQLYVVSDIDLRVRPHDTFPSDPSITYAQYFMNKYQYEMKDYGQPSVKCKPVSVGQRSLCLLSSHYKEDHDDTGTRRSEIVLFPELCSIYPLSASFWKLCRTLPSLIYRIEALLVMEEFSNSIPSIGTSTEGMFYCTTQSILAGQCAAVVDIGSTSFYTSSNGPVVCPSTISKYEETAQREKIIRRPDNALLLQAFTAASANDSIDLERMEVLGDSFLKVFTSVDLYCSRKGDHEGKLSQARQHRISNFNLCYLARKQRIPTRIFSKQFEPLKNWVPPCFRHPHALNAYPPIITPQDTIVSDDIKRFYYHKVTDKGIADCVEALIGAYLIAGGLEGGIAFLRWLGMKTEKNWLDGSVESMEETFHVSMSSSQESLMSIDIHSCTFNSVLLLIQNSSEVFHEHCLPPPSAILVEDSITQAEVHQIFDKLLSPHYAVSEKLKWTFRDKALLLQALTHPSCNNNRLTYSYQRLEFLGDAVLDYLITCDIYCRFPKFSPGQITDMRSALVNNITFAEIAVQELQIHKHLLYHSPSLYQQITNFVTTLDKIMKAKEEERKDIYCVAVSAVYNSAYTMYICMYVVVVIWLISKCGLI